MSHSVAEGLGGGEGGGVAPRGRGCGDSDGK